MQQKIDRFSSVFSIFLFCLFVLFTFSTAIAQNDSSKAVEDSVNYDNHHSLIYRLDIEGAIGTVTNDRVTESIELAEEYGADLVLITINTPGGFSTATRDICTSILNSKVPVCVYVSPSGAHAGSAGVYITYASHIAAMAYSTNIGSAHPVSGSGEEIDSVMNEKVTNDAVAQIKSYAEKHNRNVEWAEKAVRESVNITDKEALEQNVIDLRAESIADLLDKLEGRTVETKSGTQTLHLSKRNIVTVEMSFAQKLLNLLTNPNIVFILMSIAMLGITLELYNPGSILPGVVGVISLILILYSSQTLPFNYAGVALILFAAILFIAEIKIVSKGLLTVGGVISLFLGGTMLIDTVDPNLQVSYSVLISVVTVVGVLLAAALYLLVKDSKRQVFIGNEGMIGKIAEARSEGMVFVNGALWKAEADAPLSKGDKVQIESVENLKLKVKKINQEDRS
ncbi:MAG: nodulation protein NfeD [Calditrichaeota bacterium]|nr:MAG: nodulation protein NfeD [Calditrichota bacterium]